jgi:hypothetical protein
MRLPRMQILCQETTLRPLGHRLVHGQHPREFLRRLTRTLPPQEGLHLPEIA